MISKVVNLDLNNKKRLAKLLDCIDKMKLLTSVDVGGCDFDYLPPRMGRLKKLSHLDLKNNKRLLKLTKCIK